MFPGNTADVTTVKRVREDLRGWRLGRCVFVGDAGMNSQDNRHELALGNGKYILATRLRAGDEVAKEVLTRPGRYAVVLLLERVAEIRAGDSWRNIAAEIERVKVVEYEHGGVRVLQTTELPPAVTRLLLALKVAEPPQLHSIRPAPARGAAASVGEPAN